MREYDCVPERGWVDTLVVSPALHTLPSLLSTALSLHPAQLGCSRAALGVTDTEVSLTVTVNISSHLTWDQGDLKKESSFGGTYKKSWVSAILWF